MRGMKTISDPAGFIFVDRDPWTPQDFEAALSIAKRVATMSPQRPVCVVKNRKLIETFESFPDALLYRDRECVYGDDPLRIINFEPKAPQRVTLD